MNPSLAVVRDGIAGSMEAWASASWLDRVIEEVPLPFATLVKELGLAPIPVRGDAALEAYCLGIVSNLIDRDLLRIKSELLGKLQRLERDADPAVSRGLQQELVRVERERRALRED